VVIDGNLISSRTWHDYSPMFKAFMTLLVKTTATAGAREVRPGEGARKLVNLVRLVNFCPCCGFEFGNDDDPGTAAPRSFAQYLAEWMQQGCHWFDPKRKPPVWQIEKQLRSAGIPIPTQS
jgi:hypothetical protein